MKKNKGVQKETAFNKTKKGKKEKNKPFWVEPV